MSKNITKLLSEDDRPHDVADNKKNKYGQYFTPELIADFMINLADITKNTTILEPSCGEGIFIKQLLKKGHKNITGYELDNSLIPASLSKTIINESFVAMDTHKKYNLIIGNPPYIRWRNLEQELKTELSSNQLWNKHFNSLCDYSYLFILKSVELLEDGGQLIFITPEYWLNTTHSKSLRNYLVQQGYFEAIYHFNETPIFENVHVSTIVFKFIKSNEKKPFINFTKFHTNKKLTQEVLENIKESNQTDHVTYMKIAQFTENKNWLLSSETINEEMRYFENKCKSPNTTSSKSFDNATEYPTIGDICDIGNGLVSGLDKAFQLSDEVLNPKELQQRLQVVKAKHLSPYLYTNITNYIYVNEIEEKAIFEKEYPNYFKKLFQDKKKLEKRYQYNRKIPYWHWVFLRNFTLFSSSKDRIFVPCKERISNKDYFRFSFVEKNIFPTQDVTALFRKENTRESIYYILAFLNNKRVFQWLVNNGIVKGNIVEFSERPIASIPFRKIDWNNPEDVYNHDLITTYTAQYIQTSSKGYLEKVHLIFDDLLN
ncbi:MAG: restriction endonuclease [Flavobacteriaceae bacterium]|nr:MAG: restriction endonuclease [Flavobacteriaceae bacterium]